MIKGERFSYLTISVHDWLVLKQGRHLEEGQPFIVADDTKSNKRGGVQLCFWRERLRQVFYPCQQRHQFGSEDILYPAVAQSRDAPTNTTVMSIDSLHCIQAACPRPDVALTLTPSISP